MESFCPNCAAFAWAAGERVLPSGPHLPPVDIDTWHNSKGRRPTGNRVLRLRHEVQLKVQLKSTGKLELTRDTCM